MLLVGAELGHRTWKWARGAPYVAEATRVDIQRSAGALADDLPDPGGERAPAEAVDSILHPYVGFGPASLLEVQAREVRRRSAGLAGDDEFTLLLLGGSVAGGFGNERSRGIVEFERVLQEHPDFQGRELRVLRFGFGAYKQPQQLHMAHDLMCLGIVPDAILNLDGFNEVALALRNQSEGVHPIYPVFSKWGQRLAAAGVDPRVLAPHIVAIDAAREDARAWAERAARFGLHRSSLLGTLVLAQVRAAEDEHRAASQRYLDALGTRPSERAISGPRHAEELEAGLRTAVAVWAESSRSLHALCSERGIFYFHALQPTLHDVGAKPATEEELAAGRAHETWLHAARAGYPALRAAGAELRADGIAFHDASRVFAEVTEPLYYDACHFNQAGNALLGTALGAAFTRAWDTRTTDRAD